MYVCIFVYITVGFCGDQKRVLDALELEFQVFVNCLMWALGTEFRSSGGAGRTLHCLVNPSQKTLVFHFQEK